MSEGKSGGHAIETMQVEERRFKPSAEFSRQANAQPDIYERDFDEFWTKEAGRISWFEPWKQLYEWKPPFAKWYIGGKLNVCSNSVDRQAEGGRQDKVPYLSEGGPGEHPPQITVGSPSQQLLA